jgi:hypothetical protein
MIVGVVGAGTLRADDWVWQRFAAVSEDGALSIEIFNEKGLSPEECTKLLSSIPHEDVCFGFDIKGEKIFGDREAGAVPQPGVRRRWCYDAQEFTRKPFIESLEAFGIVPAERVLAANFHTYKAELIAKMMRRVLATLDEVGIPLTWQYNGPGSIADVLLKRNNVRAYRGLAQSDLQETDPELAQAIMSAYFGGRTELSVIGKVKGPLYSYDLASAFPHAMLDLPCLAHGRWRKTTEGLDEVRVATVALVHFRVRAVPKAERKKMVWAPLPCRTTDGPVWGVNFEGFGWWPEVQVALDKWPGLIEILDGWIFRPSCTHKPFDWIPGVYKSRCVLEGKGNRGGANLLKMALAATYGKTATMDESPVRSYVWAGLTTAITRARILQALEPSVISIATDGLISRRRLDLGGAGLGSWSGEKHTQGAFFAAPGQFLPEDTSKTALKPMPHREAWTRGALLVRDLGGRTSTPYNAGP